MDKLLAMAKAAGLKKDHAADREYIGDFDWRLFAQMVVEECCEVVISSDTDSKMILHEPYRTIVNNIQEHFGVQE